MFGCRNLNDIQILLKFITKLHKTNHWKLFKFLCKIYDGQQVFFFFLNYHKLFNSDNIKWYNLMHILDFERNIKDINFTNMLR